ncbi:MAG: hypothetical protein CMF59_10770 [Leptospiraceae bacterium]|nr:hypothetical protein [Leptospiraceae bacterium]
MSEKIQWSRTRRSSTSGASYAAELSKNEDQCVPNHPQSKTTLRAKNAGRMVTLTLLSLLLFLASGCSTAKEPAGPQYCGDLNQCFEECNRRYPPQHGSNEIEVCLNTCIQTHGNPEKCPELNRTPLEP